MIGSQIGPARAGRARIRPPRVTRRPRVGLRRVFALVAWGWIASMLLAQSARAHDARPLSVDITERGAALYRVRMRVPPTVEADNQPSVIWPDNCGPLRNETRHSSVATFSATLPPSGANSTTLVNCEDGLQGRQIGIEYPLYNPSLATLFRLTGRDGAVTTRVLTPEQGNWQVPREPGWREVAADYLVLGVEHIWKGLDHLLFVAGLLMLAGTMRRVLLAVTGFTLAHSITLSLSALGLVRVPVAPLEAAIALSVLFLAREVARPVPDSVARRFPILVSSLFGLLHGFGFAAALREVGLPTKELALGLLCFNLGVELGQVAFIAVALMLVWGIRKLAHAGGPMEVPPDGRAAVVAAYALGIPAAFWLLQRLEGF